MHSPEHERRAIISYWESQSPPDDEVEHAKKVTLKPCVVGSGPIYGTLTPPMAGGGGCRALPRARGGLDDLATRPSLGRNREVERPAPEHYLRTREPLPQPEFARGSHRLGYTTASGERRGSRAPRFVGTHGQNPGSGGGGEHSSCTGGRTAAV